MEDDRAALRTSAEHLMGPAEIAEVLSIDANTINVWKSRHADFPTPVRRLRSGDIWDVRDVLDWASRTGRYPAAIDSGTTCSDESDRQTPL